MSLLNSKTLDEFVKERLAATNEDVNNPVAPPAGTNQATQQTQAVQGAGTVNPGGTVNPANPLPAQATQAAGTQPKIAQPATSIEQQLYNNAFKPYENFRAAVSANPAPAPLAKSYDSYKVSDEELTKKFGEAPDLTSIIELINDDLNKKKADVEKARSLSYIPALADIAALISDHIGAAGNAVVEKRESATGKHNAFVEKMQELYRQSADRKPERVAQLMMENYKNRLTREGLRDQMQSSRANYDFNMHNQAMAASKDAFDRAKEDALVHGRSMDDALRAAQLAQQKKYNDENLRLNRQRLALSASAASSKSAGKSQTIYIDADAKDPNAFTDHFNRKIIPLNLPPDAFKDYVAIGRSLIKTDPAFARSHGLILNEQAVDRTGRATGSFAITKDETLYAKAAAQYMYEKSREGQTGQTGQTGQAGQTGQTGQTDTPPAGSYPYRFWPLEPVDQMYSNQPLHPLLELPAIPQYEDPAQLDPNDAQLDPNDPDDPGFEWIED
ncbi:MAG: hypothetical protein LBR26_09845 [Prevotella sp.]|jgi:hypothetical protein|nr:hypothetical protein [Prevotella sp.]